MQRKRQNQFLSAAIRKYSLAILIAIGIFSFESVAHADSIRILALGASNTAGKGLDSSSQAWPAQLEGLLRARGYNVHVSVSARNGMTSGEISRSATVPAGTKVVLYDTGRNNDRTRGVSEDARRANIAQIESRIRAGGAEPIQVSYLDIPTLLRQSDNLHLTPAGHARVAAQLAPKVIAAIAKRY